MSYRNDGSGRGAELVERLLMVNRVAKVVKGGRRFSFSVMVVVGDRQGRFGIGTAKARELQDAVRKATDQAKKSIMTIPLKGGKTTHHDVMGEFSAARVYMRSAPPGTGVIAGGAVRTVLEVAGVQDIVAKSLGSSNPHNYVKAFIDGVKKLHSPRHVALRRGKSISYVIQKKMKPTTAAESAVAEAEAV